MPQLDGLRAIAVLLVLWFHNSPVGRHVLGYSLGEIGVGLFFVLSGFLISGILVDSSASAANSSEKWYLLRHFYIRRLLRLAPLYWAVLLLAVILDVPTFREFWGWHAAYASNFYQWFHGQGGHGSHLWSLAVEEQFYLLWPLVLVFLPRYLQRPATISMLIAAPVFRILMPHLVPDHDPSRMLPNAWDYLGVGCLLAASGRAKFGRLRSSTLALGLLIAGVTIITAVQMLGLSWTFRQTGLALCFGWLVWSAGEGFSGCFGRLLGSPPMVFIGNISYGIYIIQGFALFYWHWFFYSSPLPGYRICVKLGIPVSIFDGLAAEIVIRILLTFLLALISYSFLESPIQSLKRFFPYTRKPIWNRDTSIS